MPPCDWALICILVNNISSGYHYYFPHAQKPGVKTVKQVPDIHDWGSELSQTALKLLTLVAFYFFDGEKKKQKATIQETQSSDFSKAFLHSSIP